MKTLVYTILGSRDTSTKTLVLDENYDTYRPKKGLAHHFLILVVKHSQLYRIAMLVYETMLSSNPLDGENREQFRKFLPGEYRDCDIVDIEQLDCVMIIEPLEIQNNAT